MGYVTISEYTSTEGCGKVTSSKTTTFELYEDYVTSLEIGSGECGTTGECGTPSGWLPNPGYCPVKGATRVEVQLAEGTRSRIFIEASTYSWGLDHQPSWAAITKYRVI